MPLLGEIAALLTAICWVGSSLAFAVASREAGAQALNQFRLYAALPLLAALALLLLGTAWPTDASIDRIALLALSGLIGLVVGDYAFFHALATIGPRLASVIMALWPGCTVGLEALRGTTPGRGELLGIALTVLGVALVLLRSRESGWRMDLGARQRVVGMLAALLGAFGQAGGFVMAGVAMTAGQDMPHGIDPLLATIVRMVAATVGMQLVVVLQRRPFAMRHIVENRKALVAACLGALCGPVFGVWLSMIARRNAQDAGVAAALMATTPVFLLPVSVWLYGARVGVLAVCGTLLAVAGVAVCLAGR